MTTPEGPGPPPDPSPDPADDRPVWGRPPAGGWGDPAGADRTRARPPAGSGAGSGAAPAPGWAPQPAPGPGAPPWAPRAGGWGGPPPGPPPGAWAPGPPAPGGPAYGPPAPGPPAPGPWAPPGAAPGYPPLPRPGDRAPRRSRTPLVVAGLVVLLLAVGAVLAFVAPGFLRSTVFDQAALQDGVRRVLVEDYRYADVAGVACGAPGERIAVRVDAAFTCTATVDGAPVTVPVRVTTADGTYEVGRPA